MKRVLTIVTLATLIMVLGVSVALATPPLPTSGAAEVDGNSGEWDLTTDFFANMHEAGKANKTVLSKLYLRYDCDIEVLYALVSLEDGYTLSGNADDHFIKLGNSNKLVDANYGNDGVAPDFEFLASDDANAEGWEGSAPLARNQTYELNIHTQVSPDRTSAVINRNIPLVTDCDETAIALSAFDVSTAGTTANVVWETGTELDNAGFNVYRSDSFTGPWVKVNETLIAATGDNVSGGEYTFIHQAGRGTYYYRLADVAFDGTETMHTPVKIDTGAAIRVPSFRPATPSIRPNLPEGI